MVTKGHLKFDSEGQLHHGLFFAIDNGWHRRCTIVSLLVNNIRIMDRDQIITHVVEFFSSLLSAIPESGFSIASSLWDAFGRITSEENEALLTPLSEDEILKIIRSANPNSGSGPGGFSIPFFRQF